MEDIAAALHRHQRIGLDSSVFIYHIEESPRYATIVRTALDSLERGAFQGLTSVLTLMELTVKPLQLDREDVARQYEVIVVNYPNLAVVEIDRRTARDAALLRARHRIRPADALQIAACLQHGATAFMTNDQGLRRVTEMQILMLDDFVDR